MASQRPVNLLIVIDKSGSMSTTPEGFDLNKWTALRLGLDAAMDATQDSLNFGLELYPYDPDDAIPLDCAANVCCTMPAAFGDAILVPPAPGVESYLDITAALDDVGPGGGTPTASALSFALDYFESDAGQALEGKKFVLLATDGGPNCNEDTSCDAEHCTANIDQDIPPDTNMCSADLQGPMLCIDEDATIAAAQALADAGVQTIVVGIPGTEAYTDVLNAVAEAGGAPNPVGDTRYYQVTTAGGVSGLETTLREITQQLIRTCELALEEVPPDSNLVNVEIDGELVPFLNVGGATDAGVASADDSGAAADAAVTEVPHDGWIFDESTSPPTVVLQGEPCDNMLANGAESVEIVFGCPRVEVDIR
ncbi:MAG TPA: vWA domain-containing protein [Polyangiaceae bacterium]|nr:vWA domain-containing protein [Polyangiaceae bacterium]